MTRLITWIGLELECSDPYDVVTQPNTIARSRYARFNIEILPFRFNVITFG